MLYKKFLNIKNFFLTVYSTLALIVILMLTLYHFGDARKIIDAKKAFYLNKLKYYAQSENKLEYIQAVLVTLSQTISTDNISTTEIYKNFEKVFKAAGLFHNIGLFDIKGNHLVSIVPVGQIKPPTDRLYFIRALEEKDFVWGEFAVSRSTGKKVIHFAMPVMDKNRNVKYIIVAVPVMERVFPFFHDSNKSKFTLLDENGVIVKSYNEKDEGKKFEYFEELKKGKEIIENKRGNYNFIVKLSLNNKPFCYIVQEQSINIFQILKEERFFNNVVFLLIFFIAGYFFILWITKKFIVEPIQILEQTFTNFNFEKNINIPEKHFLFNELSHLKDSYLTLIDTIKTQHQKIQQEKDFWYNTFNCIQDPFFIVDKDYRIIMANNAFTSTFNIAPNDIQKYHCYEIVHKSGTTVDFCPYKDIIEKSFSSTYELYFDDTKKWFLITYNPINVDGKLIGVSHYLKDITNMKLAEEERLKIERQLLHTQKLESLGVLAGGIAHDFNNILMGILGNVEMALMRKDELPDTVVYNLEVIKSASEKASHLTRQMLAYSGKGKFVIKEIELNKFIRDIFDLIKVSISKKATITLNLKEDEELIINGDPGQIEQVILNLVINANEALEDKEGLITITTGKMYCDQKYFEDTVDGHLRTFNEGEYVFFEVSDTGCGMDKETMSKIFEPFFTTKFKGRGLGLSAILGIVRGHNGAIRVYSEKGKGTSFKILFPAGKKSEKKDVSTVFTSTLKGKTVLIVDDEDLVRQVISKMIEFLGGETILAKDGLECLTKFKENIDKIDIVFLDLTMPGLSGYEVFREIKKIKENIKVILMSGYNEQEISQKLVGRGFAGFIQKPFTIEKLIDTIRKIVI